MNIQITDQIQDLLEGLLSLRQQQMSILHLHHLTESALEQLPVSSLEEYRRIEAERLAKSRYLQSFTGTEDELKLVLGQLSRLAASRQDLLKKHQCNDPFQLPNQTFQRYQKLWEMSERVADMLLICLQIPDSDFHQE